jgi:hypothetical protein
MKGDEEKARENRPTKPSAARSRYCAATINDWNTQKRLPASANWFATGG